MTAVLVVGLVVGLAAAARSTWSPCGLSMLSTITPFGERGRRHRYGATAAWFVAGAVAGGATLGAGSAALAALVGRAGASHPVLWLAAAAAAAAGGLVDAGAFGPVLPLIRRQVDDRWLARYRPWVYGAGFGWQIGVGFATYLMTAGVAVVVALGALTGSPLLAFVLAVGFGLARGCTVFLTARVATPADLRTLHARLSRLGPAVRWATVGVQAGAAVGLGVAASGALGRSAGAGSAAMVAAAALLGGAAAGGAAAGGASAGGAAAGRAAAGGGGEAPVGRSGARAPTPIIPPR